MEIIPQQKLPIFNFSTEDLPGEKWLPVYGFEEYALISQYGRVKRKTRFVQASTGAKRTYNERIFRSTIRQNTNLQPRLFHYQLICLVSAAGKHYSFNVMRMVYYLFIGGFEYHDQNYAVIAKDGNDLDLSPENLTLIDTPNFKGTLASKRPIYSVKKIIQLCNNIVCSHEVILRRAKVTCYNKEGTKITTFDSIYQAHLMTGLSMDAIMKAISEPFTTVLECYWRSGKKLTIDTAIIKMREIEIEKQRIGVQLTQFDLNGNPINYYYSTAEAAADNNLKESEILKCLYGKSQMAGYFMWRTGMWETPIPSL